MAQPEISYEGGQYTFGDFSFNWTAEVQKFKIIKE